MPDSASADAVLRGRPTLEQEQARLTAVGEQVRDALSSRLGLSMWSQADPGNAAGCGDDPDTQIVAIAGEALSVAPETFDLLEVNGDFDFEEASGVDGDAIVNGRRVPLSIGFDALDRFHEIRREFERLDQPLWRKATVEVTAAGKATLRPDYTDSRG